MIFSVKEWLEKRGVEKTKIHFELFTVPGQLTPEQHAQSLVNTKATSGKISTITIRQDGIAFSFDLPYDQDSILNAALLQGADLPFACKGGVCGTCRAKLIEGKVEMENNYALEAEELAKGFILTCQSHPRSGKVIVDYDLK
jgi:ring-1,2-phenylacetyl-CoA epoxidase subunit PaaE